MKIVVIGGSGLIGKKFVKLLGERGHEGCGGFPLHRRQRRHW